MHDPTIHVRLGTLADAPLLARHRVGMMCDLASLAAGTDVARAVEAGSRKFIAAHLAAGTWVAWIAEDASGALGSGSALLRPLAPNLAFHEGGAEAYFLNFFTEHAARRRGVATTVMRTALAWCRENGVVRMVLHASPAGRRVYEPLGFVERRDWMEIRPEACSGDQTSIDRMSM